MTTRRYRRSIRLHEPAREGPPPPSWHGGPDRRLGALIFLPTLAASAVGIALKADPCIVGLILALSGGLASGTAVRWGGAE
jgi:hypothetical protein